MAKKSNYNIRTDRTNQRSWLNYLKIFIYGIIFAIVAYILSGDASSIALGLLVMYLEYKFMKEVKK
jgi:hypothetical protein